MAVIQAVFALISRSLGRITSSIFGWAVVALFGQTDPGEKTWLSALVGAAAAWPVLLFGIAMPKIATFVLGFVPLPDWIPEWTVRLVWIGLAVVIPLAVGLTMAIRRPRGTALSGVTPPAAQEPALTRLLRGFPTTIGIAAAFLVVFVTVPALRVVSLVRRRVDVQVPLVTDRDNYHPVALEVAQVLTSHRFPVREAKPGWWMTLPSHILLRLGGPAFRDHIPERLAYFRGDRLEVALYPNGLLLRGSAQHTAWAHGIRTSSGRFAACGRSTANTPPRTRAPRRSPGASRRLRRNSARPHSPTTNGRSSTGKRYSLAEPSAASVSFWKRRPPALRRSTAGLLRRNE
jgi:hypothetical protein